MSTSPIDKYEIENTSAFDTDGDDDFEATIDFSDSGITELPATLRSETPPSGTSLSSTSRQASESDLDTGQKVHQKRLDPDATFIISLGLRANDQKFTTAAVTAKKLVRFNFSDHPVGDKDGHCFTQGLIGTDGGRRTAKNCASQSLMVFDVDNGATMDEVCQEADKRGLAYIATHTHSHMKPYSRLAESKVESLLRADGLSFDNADDDNIERAITEYLSDVKGIKKSLLDTVTGVERKMADGGMVYDLHHAPMHRSRIIFFLFETFDFENPPSHKDREQLWSESYPKIAHALKIPFDSSCGDPSRLFYFPRRPLDSDEGDYENRVQLDGNYLDLAGMCSEVDLDSSYMPPKSKRGRRLGSRNTSRNSARSYRPITPGLMRFVKDHGDRFMIADWLEANYPDDSRSECDGDKLEHRCPNADAHSDGDNDDDSAFCVWNPNPDDDKPGFCAACQHTTCITESNRDRLFYLDLLCQHYDANVGELKQFVEGYRPEDDDSLQEEEETERKISIMQSMSKTNELKVENLKRISQLTPDCVSLEKGGIQAIFPLLDDLALTLPTETECGDYAEQISSKIDKKKVRDLKREIKSRSKEAQRLLNFERKKELGEQDFPTAFYVRDEMIYMFNDDPQREDIEVCANFNVVGLCYDEKKENHGIEIRFDVDGIEKRLVIEKSLLAGDGRQLREVLMGKGLFISTQMQARAAFNVLANGLQSELRITNASKPGWYDNNEVFITPLGEAIPEKDNTTWRLNDKTRAKNKNKKGSLEGWKSDVADRAFHRDTPHFALGLMTAGAGTLVQLIGEPSCGIGLVGPSSKGKSLAQKISTSVWGSPHPDDSLCITCRSTDNALENKNVRGNGTVLNIDEAKTGSAKLITQIPFMIASGAGRARMGADGQERITLTWTTFFTYSSELPVEHFAAQLRENTVTGSTVRCPEVDVSDLTELDDPADAKAIGDATECHYGHAGPLYVRHLIKKGYNRDPDLIKGMIDIRERELVGENTPATTQRAARVFALLWVSGDLMRDAGLLNNDVEESVRWGWESYLKSMASDNLHGARRSVNRFEEWIVQNPAKVLPITHADEVSNQEVLAYRDDKNVVYLACSSLDKIEAITTTAAAFVKELERRGMLIRQGKNNTHAYIPKVGKIKHYRIQHSGIGEQEQVGSKADDK